jgi:hypothetical protein
LALKLAEVNGKGAGVSGAKSGGSFKKIFLYRFP